MLSETFVRAMLIAHLTTELAMRNEEFNEMISNWDYDKEYYLYVSCVMASATSITDEIQIECAEYATKKCSLDYMVEDTDIEHGLMFGSIIGYDKSYAELAETIWDYDGNRKYHKFEYYSELCRFLEEHRYQDFGSIVNTADYYDGECRLDWM